MILQYAWGKKQPYDRARFMHSELARMQVCVFLYVI